MKQSPPKDVEKIQTGLDDGSSTVSRSTCNSKLRRSKITSVLISGVGFLADAYDLFVIDFVVALLTATAYVEPSAGDKSLIVSATHAGAVCGQLSADFIGRRIMFITTALLVISGSLLSSLVGWGYTTSAQSFSIIYQLAICRFFLGFGIGGEYPLSATVAAETESEEELAYGTTSDNNIKGWLWYLSHKPNSIAAVFSMQGVGMLLSPLIVMLCVAIGISLEATWRLCLAVGAIPSAIAFVFRWRMHETAAFKKTQRDYSMAESAATATTALYYPKPRSSSSISEASSDSVIGHSGVPTFGNKSNDSDSRESPAAAGQKVHTVIAVSQPAAVPVAVDSSDVALEKHNGRRSWKSFGKHLRRSWQILRQFRWILLGTSATWFLIDVTLYGTGSFKSAVVGTWFIDDATTLPAESRMLGEVLRPIEFSNSRAQVQRDTLRYLLSSFEPSQEQSAEDSRFFSVFKSLVPRLLSESEDSERHKVMLQAQMGALIALMAIPGYFLSLFLIHKTGTKPLQLWGFVAVAAVFIALGVEQLLGGGIKALELILFGLTFLCSNFGPNTTTFILPTQLYPTLVRATCHGFSAAMGKLGGVLGTSLFSVLERDVGMGWLLTICGFVAILGIPFTFLIPNDKDAKERLMRDEMELTRLREEREARLREGKTTALKSLTPV